MTKKKILVTAALPYINNVPHMGHIVGCHLPADEFSRYQRLIGNEVIFVGGSDEHGTPSVVAAKELGVGPKEIGDKLHVIHKQIYEKLNISYDNYSRTSTEVHHDTVTDFFYTIYFKNFTTIETIKTLFCEKDNIALPDRFVTGTCPLCFYEHANGDQCEQCSTLMDSTELIDPTCKNCGDEPILKDSDHIYLSLEQLNDPLKEWVLSKKDLWRPHVYGEAKKWVDQGIRSRSITRDLEWGVKVPEDVLDDKVFYVWFDAPIGYMTITKELGEDVYKKFWEDPESEVYHFLGKDNIPFHTIFWPAMLLAHEGINLPENVFGYNYLTFEEQKFSKSKGHGVFCYNLLTSDIDIDTLRFYLTTALPETKDSVFRWEDYQEAVNSELIGKIGNLFNRTLNIVWKNYDGNLNIDDLGEFDKHDKELINFIHDKPKEISDYFNSGELRSALREILDYASKGNGYINSTAPWKMIKEGKLDDAKKSLYLALNLCKSLAIISSPILPGSMQNFWSEQMNLEGEITRQGNWEEADKINIPYNHQFKKPVPLYQRIDEERIKEISEHLSVTPSLEELVKGKNN